MSATVSGPFIWSNRYPVDDSQGGLVSHLCVILEWSAAFHDMLICTAMQFGCDRRYARFN